jgi:hypothetical protein
MSSQNISQPCSFFRCLYSASLFISLLLCYRNLIATDVLKLTFKINEWAVEITSFLSNDDNLISIERDKPPVDKDSTRIAYAVSVTSCNQPQLVMDGASVLQHSVRINSIRNPTSGSRYDYDMIAFVHTDATDCMQILKHLRYKIFVKKVPIQIDQIRGNYRNLANDTPSCCGEKEWLKLYAYTLTKYPIVVHLDLDCLILKPMDDLFDAMIFPTAENYDVWLTARQRIPAMWYKPDELPNKIDAFFTRDYGMISRPGRRKPHQVGVQGGFLIVRPSMADFNQYIELILEGNYTERQGWGGALKYGGYYGAGTIQGLAALFYSHLHPNRGVELNRCIYNNMADAPYPKNYDTEQFPPKKPYPCITLQKSCEDCRKTNIDDIVSIHLTNCYKPWDCFSPSLMPLICVQHWHEWYRMRYLFESKRRNKHVNVPRV